MSCFMKQREQSPSAIAMADDAPPSWTCTACTFVNSGFLTACEMCESPRSKTPRHEELQRPFDAQPDEERLAAPAALASHAGLSQAALDQFTRDGFVILRSVISSAECTRLLWERVAPALLHDGIDPFNEATWDGDGTVVKGPDGSDHPIPLSCRDSRWPALFDSPELLAVLDQLHGGRSRWSWAYGAAEGLGWVHIRFPVHNGTRWEAPEEGWHIDGDSDSLDTTSSVVVLPMLTTIRPGGGGTALLVGSHRRVASMLHRGVRVRPASLVRSALRGGGGGGGGRGTARDRAHGGTHASPAVVEATGRAGDVLLIHPLLVHAPSNAHRSTEQPCGSLTRHGLRITFNLATQWLRPPLQMPTAGGGARRVPIAARSPLEESIVGAVAEAASSEESTEAMIRYGRPIELRFVACGMVLAPVGDYCGGGSGGGSGGGGGGGGSTVRREGGDGVDGEGDHGRRLDHVHAIGARTPSHPPRAPHVLAFSAPVGSGARGEGGGAGGDGRVGDGEPVRFGDVVTLVSLHHDGLPVVVSCQPPARSHDSTPSQPAPRDSRAAAACVHLDPLGGEGRLLRVEGRCDLRGVCVRSGDRLLLRAVGCTGCTGSGPGRPSSSSSSSSLRAPPCLYADPSVPDGERLVVAVRRGKWDAGCVLEVVGVGPLRASGWLSSGAKPNDRAWSQQPNQQPTRLPNQQPSLPRCEPPACAVRSGTEGSGAAAASGSSSTNPIVVEDSSSSMACGGSNSSNSSSISRGTGRVSEQAQSSHLQHQLTRSGIEL